MLDRLTLDQLRVLIAVADQGSFSAAARRLGRVQSAVSQSVQSLETTLRLSLFDRSGKTPRLTDAGRAIVAEARSLMRGAEALRARAESIASDVEPALSLAIDPIFPRTVLMPTLRALGEAFPTLPVSLFTEGLGAAEQRLRDGVAQLAIYAPAATGASDLETEFLTSIQMIPVAVADHPLASATGLISRETLEQHVQLVLTDRTQRSAMVSVGIYSRNVWRFADTDTCYEYLLAGFGWRHMPLHMVAADLASGRVKPLLLKTYGGNRFGPPIELHVVHERSRPPGRAGRWFVAELRRRLLSPGAEPVVAALPARARRAPAQGERKKGRAPPGQGKANRKAKKSSA